MSTQDESGRSFFARILNKFIGRRKHEDFSDEVQAHIELEAERLVADGWTPADAHAAAMRAFGNVVAAKERFYEANRWMLLEQLIQDLRYAFRTLRHSPAFLATTVLTLAVGLGLVSVVFTIFNAYVLRPFAVRDPGSLYGLAYVSPDAGTSIFRWRDYEVIRGRQDLFTDVIAQNTRFVSSNGRPLAAFLVSPNYFEALAPQIVLGRPLTSADAGVDAAVIASGAWARLFANDPGVLGRTLDINGHPFTVVGVLGPTFTGLDAFPRDVWMPLTAYAQIADPALIGSDQPAAVEMIARLRPDVSVARAASALAPELARIAGKTSGVRAELTSNASPNPMSAGMLAVLSPVFAAFGLVLLTACANVSNVMLARAIARHREIAVRLSLGASRARVVRQLLTEGMLIATLAGAAALAFAFWTVRTGTALFFGTLPPSVADILRVTPLTLDYRVFFFAMAAAAAATLLFALVPALKASRLTLTDALRGQGGSSGRSRLRGALVVAQIGVSLVLIVVALTLVRNGSAIARMDLGYDSSGVLSINVRGEQAGLVPGLANALARDPRVSEVAVTNGNPTFIRMRPVAAGPEDRDAATLATRYTFVSPEYFSILRIPIQSGRGFSAQEARSNAAVAIISAATARAFWPGQSAIGRTIRVEPAAGRPVEDLPGYTHLLVIGVAPDVVSGLVIDGPDAGHIYLPTTEASAHATAVLARGRSADALGPQALQEIFAGVARDPQVFEAIPLREMYDLQMYPLVAASWIGAALAVIALGLSVAGLYGVLSYTLTQRTKEIGIRIALGANAAAVVLLVMRQSARLAGIGAAAGLIVSFAAMKALGAVIPFKTVSMVDGLAFGGGLIMVLFATALAAYRPAARAARVDPALTLRAE
jgi:predicted permease